MSTNPTTERPELEVPLQEELAQFVTLASQHPVFQKIQFEDDELKTEIVVNAVIQVQDELEFGRDLGAPGAHLWVNRNAYAGGFFSGMHYLLGLIEAQTVEPDDDNEPDEDEGVEP